MRRTAAVAWRGREACEFPPSDANARREVQAPGESLRVRFRLNRLALEYLDEPDLPLFRIMLYAVS